MDTKQALDILNLTADASLEDAKVSFRILAKKYHPDKLINNDEKITDHEKMKDINLAFHNLKNILKPKKISTPAQDITDPKVSKQKRAQKKAETKKTNFSVGFTSLFKTIREKFF
ncbi:MAG: DnaJ domain-containing protein, partial [Desulfobacteraceae bacterium]|nr:DnaJ domain-containing protein [Desulfobacteraceae bacterium]